MKNVLTFLISAILALSLAGCATNRQYTDNSLLSNIPEADDRII